MSNTETNTTDTTTNAAEALMTTSRLCATLNSGRYPIKRACCEWCGERVLETKLVSTDRGLICRPCDADGAGTEGAL